MTDQPVVILVGLPSHHELVPEHLRDTVKAGVKALPGLMADAGIPYEYIEATPENTLEELTAMFKTRQVSGVVIGMGIRAIPACTLLFEKLVEAVRQGAPSAKLAFNTSPDTTVDAALRLKAPPSPS